MKFFIDTANFDDIKAAYEMGFIAGVTTNPSLIVKEKRDLHEVIQQIADLVEGPVSAEVIATTAPEMVKEAHELIKLGDNVVIKVPMTAEGLKAVSVLSKEGIKTNVTLIFTVSQGLMAMKAGATFISPFVGRLEDIGTDAYQLIADLRTIIDIYDFETEIIAASIRNSAHVEAVAKLGAHIATIPDNLFEKMTQHPLTTNGIAQFMKDWEAFKK